MMDSSYHFYKLGPGVLAARERVQLKLAGGSMVGITDSRFPSPLVSGLGPEWPGLIYNKELKPGLNTGERVSPEIAARLNTDIAVELNNPSKKFPARLPDALRMETPIVSRLMVEIIESIEPRRHQFFPLKFHAVATGEPLYEEQEFHYWNILNWIAPDVLYDLDGMEGAAHIETSRPKGPGSHSDLGESPLATHVSIQSWNFQTWSIRSEWIGIGHAFRTGSYSRSRLYRVSASSFVFVSEELHSAFKKELPPTSFESSSIGISSS